MFNPKIIKILMLFRSEIKTFAQQILENEKT